MIFKLQVKRVLHCRRCLQTHSEDRLEARPLFLPQGQQSRLRTVFLLQRHSQLSVCEDSSRQERGSPVPERGA